MMESSLCIKSNTAGEDRPKHKKSLPQIMKQGFCQRAGLYYFDQLAFPPFAESTLML